MLDVGRAAVGEESSRFGDTIGPRHLKVSFHPSSCMSSAGLPHTDMRHYARDRDSQWARAIAFTTITRPRRHCCTTRERVVAKHLSMHEPWVFRIRPPMRCHCHLTERHPPTVTSRENTPMTSVVRRFVSVTDNLLCAIIRRSLPLQAPVPAVRQRIFYQIGVVGN